MVRLLTWCTEQHMQGIANNLCNRTIVRKHEICHAQEVVIEKRTKHVGFKRLYKRRETGNVCKQCCDLSSLPTEINSIRIARKSLGQVGGEVTRERSVRPFRLRLAPSRFTQDIDMPNGLRDRCFKIEKINRLGQEIKCTAIRRRRIR